jgi:hypothetical protein
MIVLCLSLFLFLAFAYSLTFSLALALSLVNTTATTVTTATVTATTPTVTGTHHHRYSRGHNEHGFIIVFDSERHSQQEHPCQDRLLRLQRTAESWVMAHVLYVPRVRLRVHRERD